VLLQENFTISLSEIATQARVLWSTNGEN